MSDEHLKYPIGRFTFDKSAYNDIEKAIGIIEKFPSDLSELVNNLPENVLDNPYRPGGWTARKVIHHCADSHMNSVIRFKLALTEDVPVIKPYDEGSWAELADSKMPIAASLSLLQGLHARWTVLLRSISYQDFQKEFMHPEHNKKMSHAEALMFYSWHCRHHFEHVRQSTIVN